MAWAKKNLLDLDRLDREDLELIMDQAGHMDELLDRPIKKVPALRGKLIVNAFFEPSTRTRVSFELAEKFLGADVVNWSASGSSTKKGETLRDTAWTLEAMGADAVVIRHPMAGAPFYLHRKLFKASVFNAGDGARAHPTQGLLDAYTLWKKWGSLDSRKIVIIGDVLHSRVVRSNARAFSLLGAEVVLSGPRTMMPRRLDALGAEFEPDPRQAVKDADAVYLLRIQKERQQAGLFPTEDEYHRRFGADRDLLALAKPEAAIMHPGPMNRGVEIASELADGPESLILAQVRSGVCIRMALLFLCLGGAS